MWSSGGLSKESQSWTAEQRQWSAQQSNLCLSVPHESVDWAQLAKQWIHMQSQPPQPTTHNPMLPMTGSMPRLPPMQSIRSPLPPMPPQMPPMPPMGTHFMQMAHNVGHRPQHIIPEDTSRPVYQTPIDANNWIRSRPPPPPPQPLHTLPPMPPMAAIPSPPPNSLPPHNFQSSYGWRPPNVGPNQSPTITANDNHKTDKMTVNQLINLDAVKKKNLPIWLREGLEKMEKEKTKKIEKQKEEHHRIQHFKAIRDKEEELRREIELEQKMSSRYRSDSDDNGSDNHSNDGNKSDPEDVRLTEEQLMLKVRKWMTEILLKVTTNEIEAIARDILNKSSDRVSAVRQTSDASSFKKPSKLGGSLTVLTGYGSESDESDDQQKDTSNRIDAQTDQISAKIVDKNNGNKNRYENKERKSDDRIRTKSESDDKQRKRQRSRSRDKDRKRSSERGRDKRSRSRGRRSRSRDKSRSRGRRSRSRDKSRSIDQNSRSKYSRKSRDNKSVSKERRSRSRSSSRDNKRRRHSRSRSNSMSRSNSKERRYRRTSSKEESRKYK